MPDELEAEDGRPLPFSRILAVNVRAERVRRGWSQDQLAARMPHGWSKSMISDVEVGRRRLAVDEIPVFCRALRVGFRRLLVGVDPEDLESLDLMPQV